MCSDPVTFGGGITIEKHARPLFEAAKAPELIQWLYHLASTSLWE
jgi:hypothetical protein